MRPQPMPRTALVLAPYALGLVALALAACGSAGREAPMQAGRAEPRGVGFVVVGDTGLVAEAGKSGMMPVANAMHQYCGTANCRFALMVGDNIYQNGAAGDGGDSELFRTRFTEPFGRFANLGPDFRFYVALGNHDWYTSRAGALAQVTFHERNRPFHMKGLFYSVRPPGLEEQVEIFIVDTEMLLAPVAVPDMEAAPDGSMVDTGRTRSAGGKNALPRTAAERDQLGWLEQALARSTAKWKLVVGHHPLWQSRPDSKYAQSVALREMLLPMLCRYSDAYLAGHQHTLELAADRCIGQSPDALTPLPNIVSGSGAKAREINPSFQAWQQRTWPQLQQLWATGDQWGFVHVTIGGGNLDVRMIAVERDGTMKEAFRHSFADRPTGSSTVMK